MTTIYLHRLEYEPVHFVTCRRRSYRFETDYLTAAAQRTNERLLAERRRRRRLRGRLRLLVARIRSRKAAA